MPPKPAHGATPAVVVLHRAGVSFMLHGYDAEGPAAGRGREDRPAYGTAAAAALGVDPGRIFKTLIADVDGRLVAALVPVSGELDLKRLAIAAAGRRANLAQAGAAERTSGSVVGAISPLGMRRSLPAFIDESVLLHATILVSAGRRGLQVEVAPDDLVRLTSAVVARIART